MDVQDGGDAERERLLRLYEALPKTDYRIRRSQYKHSDIRPEWIAAIVENPYDVREVLTPVPHGTEPRTLFIGRVPEFRQWICVVMIGWGEDLELHTSYADKRLEKDYGGRPWPTQR